MHSTKNMDLNALQSLFTEAKRSHQLDGNLAGYAACLLFQEPSTRTRLSFSLAAQHLGMYVETLDLDTSSTKKGESMMHTAYAIKDIGYDLLVLRANVGHLPAMIERDTGLKTINAGDGVNEHPTQTLIDLYTMSQTFGTNDFLGLRVAIVGDILYSRVAHSLIPLLDKVGAQVKLCTHRMTPEYTHDRLNHIDDAVNWGADVIYMLRYQSERGSEVNNLQQYQLRDYHLQGPKIMHPGPVNFEVEILNYDTLNHEDCLIRQQVANGLPIRKAVMHRKVRGWSF